MNRHARRLAGLAAAVSLVWLAGCARPAAPPEEPAQALVRTGAEVAAADGFAAFSGMRVGLIVNHTSLVGEAHLADLVHAAPGVELAALFGPEHGIRGDAVAGAAVADGRDSTTGVPVFSLYGSQRKPTPEQLAGLDALVFDIQDVGARFYTYISTMGLAMEAAAEAGLPFFVLDRPNPLGGLSIEGYIREDGLESFVGQFPIPVTHGMTVGELATMIQGEGWQAGMRDRESRLHVVRMDGWRRGMRWEQLGRAWTPPSPNIPDMDTASIYPGTCFFEALDASEGRGTYAPFRQVGASWADGAALADTLNARGLAGVRFEPIAFVPEPIAAMATSPRFAGDTQHGVRVVVTDPFAMQPVAVGIHMVQAFYAAAPDDVRDGFINSRWMSLLAGTARIEEELEAGRTAEAIVRGWEEDVAAFATQRKPYLLYD